MKKRLPVIFILFLIVYAMSSCAVARQPNWYYYRGGYFTYKTSPIYNRHGHWKGGSHSHTNDNINRSYARAVRCPRR